MFDTSDASWDVAQQLYERCAYEALASMRNGEDATTTAKWVNLANAVADLWIDSDKMVVEAPVTPAE